MKISLIVNTCAIDPLAAAKRNPWRQSTYGDRKRLIYEEILPRAHDFDEIIIAGQFESYSEAPIMELPQTIPDFVYAEVPPQYNDRRDALTQREMGARVSTGDLLVFTHDDHAPADDFVASLQDYSTEYDIIVPKRVHALSGETLNNGQAEGYMGGHLLVMKRDLWARVPWTRVQPPRCWDIWFTQIWREAGAKIVWDDDLTCIDLEALEHES